MSYEGQPEYVCTGFQKDLLYHWAGESTGILPHDEWGRELEAMYALAEAMGSCSDERMGTVIGWIWEELKRWQEEDWYGDWDSEENEIEKVRAIRQAQGSYEETVEYWRERAKGFNGSTSSTKTVASDALEEVIASLPDWLRPDPNAAPLPDPELETYERLKRKFG